MKSISSHPTSRRATPRRGVPRTALVVLAALAPVLGLVVVAQPVGATLSTDQVATRTATTVPASSDVIHKSYVCKYVGTPGVDETLQTGQNPIWVDNHSLTGKDDSVVQVGDTFSDKQGKSVVIVANTAKLDPEPGVDQCPAPVGPTKVTATAPTATAPTCYADGTLTVPADTESISYASQPSGTGPGDYTVTATATQGYVIDGTSSWDITVLPMLTGAVCLTTVTPVAPTVAPSAICEVQGTYTIPATTGITYLLDGKVVAAGTHGGPASGLVTATANEGYTLSDASWKYQLTVAAPELCPAAVVEPPTGTTTPTEVTPPAETVTPAETPAAAEPTAALPKTGASTSALAAAGALALLLGLALLAGGTRRPRADLN